ncbi:tetratricopeptide repeat-containing response regulator [Pseudoalteromonas denitrificans]|uniref:DNA-binding response regulator, NarL/FixJ family, contains REC and HTH domains n=1 Tax=Pseudoalteromonas denitrificans DSM 6059 TaxID=1123010 RepID=A0A1I1KVF2_9GAMM|nr:tetratricopeptide repeat-containing response regulator [Pseudoalteromonas denitrificans]SFC64807.1 DNA-binding response regulator, NarL/FixJ family, contains REC and HTH domains [Pseudoalteromonas denitrificans DSM 6059]
MPEKEIIDFKERKVLIVDDQRSFQTLLKGMLFGLGARNIHFADTGESAIKQCMEIKFDLLFIDYNLGLGKNGRQLLEELRIKKCLAVGSIYMIVSGETTRPMVLGAVEAEPDDYLIKPFSQGVLKNRIHKVFNRKKTLKKTLSAISNDDKDTAITEVKKIISCNNRYRQYCTKLLSNLYKEQKNFEQAEQLLVNELNTKRVAWALISLADIFYQQKLYRDALALCNEVLQQNRFRVEAHDIKAKCLLAQGEKKQALDVIKKSAVISPYSFTRQYLFADIARKNSAYNSLICACQSVLAMSKRSIHQNIEHQLNYVRSLLDAAQNTDNAPDKEHYIKESKLAIQQAKNEKSLFIKTPFSSFEALCHARIDAVQGKFLSAKKILADANCVIEENKETLPYDLYPESILTLLQIGEFEAAFEQQEALKQHNKNSQFVESMILDQTNKAQENIRIFEQHNKEGIEEYKKGNFSLAIEAFEKALEYAPVNTGSALNLIQALIQVLQHSKKNRTEVAQKCSNTFKLVDGIKLPHLHEQRYNDLKADFKRVSKTLKHE